MPYKVLVVDDEPMIRFGLCSCLDWQAEGFELAGDAANGEAAMEIVSRVPIDILITDIKMPLMDGLELTRRVKERIPRVKVVLVSSFSDFEYAREAVKLGVVLDYLLKPTMEPEDLQRILRGCKELLDKEAEDRRQTQQLSGEADRTRRLKLEGELRGLLSGSGKAPEWKPEWLADSLRIAVWKSGAKDPATEAGADADAETGASPIGRLMRLEWAKERINADSPHGISFLTGDAELAMVIADRSGRAMSDLTAMQARLKEEGHPFTVGISPPFSQIGYLKEAYGWAAAAAEQGFVKGLGRCYEGSIPAPSRAKQEKKEESDRHAASLRESFSKALASFEPPRCLSALEDFAAFWRSSGIGRPEILHQARGLIALIWSIRQEWKTDEYMKRWLEKLHALGSIESLDSLVAFLRKELSRIDEPTGLPILAEDAGGVHVIQMALSYIQEHYKDDLTLQEVADFVHMSKNYFSEQFKRHTGNNFIDFVIRLRIHHAKHLLETTHLKVLEVGFQSGFHSPKHFLKLFKRLVGTTPAEYREHCRSGHQTDRLPVQGGS